jgi:hypothetical protein
MRLLELMKTKENVPGRSGDRKGGRQEKENVLLNSE